MKTSVFSAVLAATIVMAGCGVDQAGPGGATSPASYRVLATGETEASYTVTTSPGVSSLSWTPPTLVQDGNNTSAWGPASTTPTPSLTLTLSKTQVVTSVAAKVSLGQVSSTSNHRVLIDVYAWVDGAWKVIGEGLNPPETVLTNLDVADTVTDKLRIDFRRSSGDNLQLFVCTIDVFGKPVPTPTPTPVVTPTPTPTPTPTMTPTPPHNVNCCKVTGGGEVPSLSPPVRGRNNYVSFGFNAQEDPDSGAKGQLQVVDHASGERWHVAVTDIIYCDHATQTVEFVGTVTNTNTGSLGASARVRVSDLGEPGRDDRFSFWVNGTLEANGDLKGPRPGGGNIQFHETKCH